MVTQIISKLAPKNDGSFPTHSDIHCEGGFQVRDDITDRNSIPTLNRKEGMWVNVLSENKVYTLSGGITDGYWMEISSPFKVVNTLEERDNISESSRTEGMLVHVISDNRTYTLTGGIENTDWMVYAYNGYSTQDEWYIDPSAGNDSATGAIGEPLKTFREFARRMNGVLKQRTHVIIMGNLPSTDPLALSLRVEWDKILSPSQPPELDIEGTTSSPAFSSTVTSAANAVPSSNSSPTLTDTSVANFTTHVGKIVRVTSGASNGASAWVALNLGSNTARVSEWISPTGFLGGVATAPSGGDTYSIYDQITVDSNPDISLFGGSGAINGSLPTVIIQNIKFNSSVVLNGSNTLFHECYFPGVSTKSSSTYIFSSSHIKGNSVGTSVADTLINFIFKGCLFTANFFGGTLSPVGQVSLYNSLFQASSISAIQATYTITSTGFFDVPAAAIGISRFSTVVLNDVYGSSNSTGVSIFNSDVFHNGVYLTGTTVLDIDGATSFLPKLSTSAGGSLPALSSCINWTQLNAAPFSGILINYDTGTRINPT